MMMSEFIDRTGYTPVEGEYAIIEDSYYDFQGNKDEFCEQWLKDKKNGRWEVEKKLRENLAKAKKELKNVNKLLTSTYNFMDKVKAEKAEALAKAKELETELAKVKNENEFLKATAGAEITYKLKNGEKETKRVEAVKYIDNGIQFINVIEESGWTTSIRISDLETFEIK